MNMKTKPMTKMLYNYMQKIYHGQTAHKKLKHLVRCTAEVSVYVAIYVTGSEAENKSFHHSQLS